MSVFKEELFELSELISHQNVIFYAGFERHGYPVTGPDDALCKHIASLIDRCPKEIERERTPLFTKSTATLKFQFGISEKEIVVKVVYFKHKNAKNAVLSLYAV